MPRTGDLSRDGQTQSERSDFLRRTAHLVGHLQPQQGIGPARGVQGRGQGRLHIALEIHVAGRVPVVWSRHDGLVMAAAAALDKKHLVFEFEGFGVADFGEYPALGRLAGVGPGAAILRCLENDSTRSLKGFQVPGAGWSDVHGRVSLVGQRPRAVAHSNCTRSRK